MRFIAQEVETVIPNLGHQNMGINRVSKNSDKQGYGQGKIVDDYSDAYKDDAQSEWSKSVEKTGMIPILVEALKVTSLPQFLATYSDQQLLRALRIDGLLIGNRPMATWGAQVKLTLLLLFHGKHLHLESWPVRSHFG